MSKANMIAVGLTVLGVLVALFVVKTIDKDRNDKVFS